MNNTDSFELSYLRTMTKGLATNLRSAIACKNWDLVSLIADEIERVPADGEKAAKSYAERADARAA